MTKRVYIEGKRFFDGDLISFTHKGKDEKGLLFYNESTNRFMILLSNDFMIPVSEAKNVKLTVYEDR